MEGMTYGDVKGMLSVDREWYLRRLFKQLKKESDQSKKAGRPKRGRRR